MQLEEASVTPDLGTSYKQNSAANQAKQSVPATLIELDSHRVNFQYATNNTVKIGSLARQNDMWAEKTFHGARNLQGKQNRK